MIIDDWFISVNNVLRQYNEKKNEIKNPEISVEYIIWKQWKPTVSILKNITIIKTEKWSYQIELYVARKNRLNKELQNFWSI